MESFKRLEAAGVKCDFREPNVIRVAPTPLYNTFHEAWRFAKILAGNQ
jgi:kynureninase